MDESMRYVEKALQVKPSHPLSLQVMSEVCEKSLYITKVASLCVNCLVNSLCKCLISNEHK